jgi:hypothetical protein
MTLCLMTARSRSARSHPGTRPVNAALVPRINSVQSPWLSSIQRPALFRFTIRLTRGGVVFVIRGFSAGLKLVPAFGGGFFPFEGALGKLIGLGRGNPDEIPVPMIVEAFPDSKIATYTNLPSALEAIARGRLPWMTKFVTHCLVATLKT